MAEILDLDKFVFDQALDVLDIAFDINVWAKSIDLNLETNQVEIVSEMCKPESSSICILASRSGGKSYAVAVGAIRLCLSIPGYDVLVFAPKASQAKRLVGEMVKICKTSDLRGEIDWNRLSQTKLEFKNGSTVLALSADETAEVEGWHGNLCILDESQKISDLVYRQRITPMLAASANPKYVKLGISMYNNHFKKSFFSKSWVKLIYPWYKCPLLYKEGNTVEIDGKKYPKLIIEQMPLEYKRERFPNHPELHEESSSGLLKEDFDTQYEMKWVDSLNLFLKQEDQFLLSGTHGILKEGNDTETYFFGLDLAGGEEIKQDNKHDYSSLCIGRKVDGGIKEVVAMYLWQGNIVDQVNEIIALVHPKFGRFKCVGGVADYGNLGSAVVDLLNKHGIDVKGIKFKATESKTGLNFKNAMFKQFLFELRQGKFKYPNRKYLNTDKVYKQHIEEWCALERRETKGLNDTISAPSSEGLHDDTVCSAILFNWASERVGEFGVKKRVEAHSLFPSLNIGSTLGQNRELPPKSRFL